MKILWIHQKPIPTLERPGVGLLETDLVANLGQNTNLPSSHLMASSTKLLQWNCRGLKCNFNELQILCQDHNPLVIALQETRLKESF